MVERINKVESINTYFKIDKQGKNDSNDQKKQQQDQSDEFDKMLKHEIEEIKKEEAAKLDLSDVSDAEEEYLRFLYEREYHQKSVQKKYEKAITSYRKVMDDSSKRR